MRGALYSQFVHIFQTLFRFDLHSKYEALVMEERVYREVQTLTDLANGILEQRKNLISATFDTYI